MNFSFDSVKLSSKSRNEDFCFDVETARGQFFAVLDFASHDYANLNVTLKGKLESLVSSFGSLPDFSDDLFLGFMAKETNNFVSNLAEQSGDPVLLFSAAFCLLSGSRLSYVLSGDVRIILSSDSLTAPQAAASTSQLGEHKQEAPMTDQVRGVTLNDDDLVLIMTQGLVEVMPADVASLRGSDPKAICESLMKSSRAGGEDRTLVVIGGPYDQQADAALPTDAALAPDAGLAPDAAFPTDGALSDVAELADFKASLASLEARLDALTGNEGRNESDAGRLAGNNAAELEQKVSQQLEGLKDDLKSKAASIDLLEFDEKIKALNALLARKADRAEVLGLQRDVLKFGLAADRLASTGTSESAGAVPLLVPDGEAIVADIPSESPAAPAEIPQSVSDSAPGLQPTPWLTSFNIKAAVVVVVISLVAGFVGGWLHSSGNTKSPEVWSVKSSGSQIVISRLDGPATEAATINMAEPVKSTGEQKFSSFADVTRYIDTITNISVSTEAAPVPTTQTSQASPLPQSTTLPDNVREIAIKSGDTLQKLSQAYHVPPEKLKELNPSITRWPAVRIGQKVFVPAAGSAPESSPTPQVEPSPVKESSPNTTQVGVKQGDSLDKIARRFNTTTERLKELNPNIPNWRRLQIKQKVVVPTPGG